jgi:hypothetical protein
MAKHRFRTKHAACMRRPADPSQSGSRIRTWIDAGIFIQKHGRWPHYCNDLAKPLRRAEDALAKRVRRAEDFFQNSPHPPEAQERARVVELAGCPPKCKASAAARPSCELSLTDVVATPVKKARASASDQWLGSPAAAADDLDATPQQGLTPSSAVRLAQSSRNTQCTPMGCPDDCSKSVSAPSLGPASAQMLASAAALQKELLQKVDSKVRALYIHIQQERVSRSDADYLPHRHRHGERPMHHGSPFICFVFHLGRGVKE